MCKTNQLCDCQVTQMTSLMLKAMQERKNYHIAGEQVLGQEINKPLITRWEKKVGHEKVLSGSPD